MDISQRYYPKWKMAGTKKAAYYISFIGSSCKDKTVGSGGTSPGSRKKGMRRLWDCPVGITPSGPLDFP